MINYPLSDKVKESVIKALNTKQDKLSIPETVRKSALLHTIVSAPTLTQEILMKGWTDGNFKVYSQDGLTETSPLKIAAENYRDNQNMDSVLTFQTLLRFGVKHENIKEIIDIINSTETKEPNVEVVKQITLSMLTHQDESLDKYIKETAPEKKVYDSSFADKINPEEFYQQEKEKKSTEKINKGIPEMNQETMIKYPSGKELPVEFFRSRLKTVLAVQSKYKKSKVLEEPNWLVQQNEMAKEFWARMQMSTLKSGSSVETAGFNGVAGLLTAYGVLGAVPMFMPQIYNFLDNALGWTNLVEPDWVSLSPVAGIAMVLLAVPHQIMGFLDKTNQNKRQKEINKIVAEAIEENLIDPQKFMEELRDKGGFKKTFKEKLLKKDTQQRRIDVFIYNAIKDYNKTAKNKVNSNLEKGQSEDENNSLYSLSSKEMLNKLKQKISSGDSVVEDVSVDRKNRSGLKK